VSALATYLRDRAAEDIRRMDPEARIRLALSLGDDDLTLDCAAAGLDPVEARMRVLRQRQVGRRPSVSASR
jgi:hypothetical protein